VLFSYRNSGKVSTAEAGRARRSAAAALAAARKEVLLQRIFDLDVMCLCDVERGEGETEKECEREGGRGGGELHHKGVGYGPRAAF